MQKFQDAVISTNGDAIVGATVVVTTAAGAQATLYASNGSDPISGNVLTTDAAGRYGFFASNGRYTLTIFAAGFVAYVRDIVMLDPVDDEDRYATEWGADPTATQVSTAQIQDAIDDAHAAGGGVVSLAGRFLVDSVEDGATGYRIALRLKTGVKLRGGTLVCNAGSDVDPDILVMVSVIGSDTAIDGVTFENLYNGSNSWRSVAVGCGDGLDPDAVPMENVQVTNCTFNDQFYAVSVATLEATETLAIDGVLVNGCRFVAAAASTTSGGYNFYSRFPGAIRRLRVIGNYGEGAKGSSGINILGCQDGTVSANVLKDCHYGAIQTENGARRIAISGNTAIDCGRGVFIDDSADITVTGNNLTIVEKTLPDSSTAREGIFITRQGFSAGGNTDWVTDRINIVGNVINNSRIRMSTFGGSPAGSFGSINIQGNSIYFSDAGDSQTSGIATGSGTGAYRICGNTVIGASTYSLAISASSGQPVIVTGNYTGKIASESSVGVQVLGTPNLIFAENYFDNGLDASVTGIRAEVANLNAGVGRRIRITNGLDIYYGSGAPSVVASPGSLYLDTAGGTGNTLYVKEANFDETGWAAK